MESVKIKNLFLFEPDPMQYHCDKCLEQMPFMHLPKVKNNIT